MAARMYPSAEDRFWAKVEKHEGGCWLWMGAKIPPGYGSFMPDGRRSGPRRGVRAHVFAWQLLNGAIPDGCELHHLIEEGICTSTLCVNPEHLRAVTRREHVQRGQRGFAAVNANKTRCPKGHPLSGDNLLIDRVSGARRCRICRHRYDGSATVGS